MTKRNRKNKIKVENINEMEVIGKVIGVIIVILCLFGLFTAIVLGTKDKTKDDNKTDDDAVTNEILPTTMFNQSDDEYYVMIYNFNDTYKSLFNKTSIIDDKKVYKVNLSSGFSKSLISDKSIITSSIYSEIKVKDYALIKVVNGKNVKSYSTYEEIVSVIETDLE
ncbi:MAG: hypothetical protein ACK5HL_00685 [Bacilli bacterium]